MKYEIYYFLKNIRAEARFSASFNPGFKAGVIDNLVLKPGFLVSSNPSLKAGVIYNEMFTDFSPCIFF